MIDWTRVEELRCDVGDDDFEEVMSLFLEEVEAVMAGLGTSSDSTAAARDLHFLKGSTMNVGFAALARMCSEGEAAALAGRVDEIDFAAIRESFSRSRAELQAGSGGAGN
jgi:HPt (histidine-containing phosphotransfer) domain-containing protein